MTHLINQSELDDQKCLFVRFHTSHKVATIANESSWQLRLNDGIIKKSVYNL